MKLRFAFRPEQDGVAFQLVCSRLLRGETLLPVEQWEQNIDASIRPAYSLLMRLYEESSAVARGDSILLSHSTLANLGQAEAYMLGLPPVTPFNLHMQSVGNISQQDFQIETSWLTPQGTKALGAKRCGAMLQYRSLWQRIPATLFNLCEAIQAHNALPSNELDDRRKQLAAITALLPNEAQNQVIKDGFLSSLRVYHAAALSLSLSTYNGKFDFMPVLFGQHQMQCGFEENSIIDTDEAPEVVTEKQSLLPQNYQETFKKHFAYTYPTTRASYVLGDNRYAYIEPMLQQALDVVRRMRNATLEMQRDFIRNPQRFFKEELGEQFDEMAIDAMFIPTQEYSERVIGLGLWTKKALPWIQKTSNKWIPESYGITSGNVTTVIHDSNTAQVNIDIIKEAIASNALLATISGAMPDSPENYPNTSFSETLTVPANQETLNALESIQRLVQSHERAQEEAAESDLSTKDDSGQNSGPIFLGTEENIDSTTYNRYQPRAKTFVSHTLPLVLKTGLKPHQKDAVEWLINMWSGGYSGALLADDMGLGKTLTCLTFIAWLQQARKELGYKKLPILIVAPTSLIGNWQQEADTHLHAPGLGGCLVISGGQIKSLRKQGVGAGRDICDGTSRLDTGCMEKEDWILTTYETLRDYHHSFAAMPLAAVVYDEMQKAKNPTSQISCAIRTLNSEFSLGLTGTPIENSLTDMWAIIDVLLPGFLGELRQFNATYANAEENTLRALKSRLEGKESDDFRPMLRRMKDNTLAGLPTKHEHVLTATMPPYQAETYEKALTEHSQALALLQALRMVSLHPVRPDDTVFKNITDYLTGSARFNTMWSILDSIYEKHEKALIFLEAREHQPVLAMLLQERYHLQCLPIIINGQTPGALRQRYVNSFQNAHNNFDVIILSPKAAGVGLTLTAANHVVHLSRWWNPAVEDQCTDRVYRLGQHRDVHVYYPLAEHSQPHLKEYSFDLQLHKLLERKRNLSRDVLLPPQTGTEASDLYEMVHRS